MTVIVSVYFLNGNLSEKKIGNTTQSPDAMPTRKSWETAEVESFLETTLIDHKHLTTFTGEHIQPSITLSSTVDLCM